MGAGPYGRQGRGMAVAVALLALSAKLFCGAAARHSTLGLGTLALAGTTARHLLQEPSDGPPGTVPEDDVEIPDTQSEAAYAPMSAMSGMPQPGPQFQSSTFGFGFGSPRALSEPCRPREPFDPTDNPFIRPAAGSPPRQPSNSSIFRPWVPFGPCRLASPLGGFQQRPIEAPEGAPAGEPQPDIILEAKTPKNADANAAHANPKGENHVNPPAKIATASPATAAAAANNVKTTAGRKLQAIAPAPAPKLSDAIAVG